MRLSNKFGHLLSRRPFNNRIAVCSVPRYRGTLTRLSSLPMSQTMNLRSRALTSIAIRAIPEISITKPPSAALRPDQRTRMPPAVEISRRQSSNAYVARLNSAAGSVKEPATQETCARTLFAISIQRYKRQTCTFERGAWRHGRKKRVVANMSGLWLSRGKYSAFEQERSCSYFFWAHPDPSGLRRILRQPNCPRRPLGNCRQCYLARSGIVDPT